SSSGVELETLLRPIDFITLRASYAYIQSDSSSVVRLPRNSASLNADFHYRQYVANVTWSFSGSGLAIFLPQAEFGSQINRLDLSAGYLLRDYLQIYFR